nr:MAG TPA: major capsid protein [Caudoviricetes sp.]
MNREEKIAKAQELIDEGHLDEAKALIAEIKGGDAQEDKEVTIEKSEDNEIKNVENDRDHEDNLGADEKFEKEQGNKEAEKGDSQHEEKLHEDVHEDVEDIEDLKDDLEELKKKKHKKSEKRSLEAAKGEDIEMEKVVLEGKELANNEKSEVRGFLNYLRGKQTGTLPETRALPADLDGMKSVDGSAIIPEEILTKARMLPETVYDLRKHVTTQKVMHAVGKYPILKSNQAKLASVNELLKNPDLENPQFTEVQYNVETYRGQLAVAQEALDDSDDNLGGIIARHIQRQALNTANDAIAVELRKADAVAATGIDDIKDAINTGFDPAYRLEFIVSQSFYNSVDKLKNADGTYLLQPDVTAKSGKSFLGLPVTIVSDELLGGKKGEKVAFLGEPAAYAVFFDRVDTSVRWVENMYYGQVLAVAMRFDTQVVDPAAGKFITFAPAVVPGA